MRYCRTKHKDIGDSTKRVRLSFVNRHLMYSGKFKPALDSKEITGDVSNVETLPSGICNNREYQSRIRALARAGMEAEEMYRSIAMEDAKYAADLLLPVFQRTQGRDGLLGIAVSPEFAYDVEALLEEGHELWEKASRPNIMIQIPSTAEAVPAIRNLLEGGINVNATLLYSFSRYREVALAYIAAMTERFKKGSPLAGIVSAATFSEHLPFQAIADKNLQGEVMVLPRDISGSTARLSTRLHRSLFQKGIFPDLAARGAQPQLLMWVNETDSTQAIGGFGCAVELTVKFSESMVDQVPIPEQECRDFDRLLDLLQEETIKRQVIDLDTALKALQARHTI